MPARWIIFRVICILQIVAAGFMFVLSLMNFANIDFFSGFIRITSLLLCLSLSVFAINVLNNNYPDNPIEGKQKSSFNILYLLNFLFLAFLFSFFFSQFYMIRELASISGRGFFGLPTRFYISLYTYGCMVILQLIIFYGLFKLRKEIYRNFQSNKFEFEKN